MVQRTTATLCALLVAALTPPTAVAAPDDPIELAQGLQSFRRLQSHFKGPRLRRAGMQLRRGRCGPALRELSRLLSRRELPASHRGPAAFAAGLCAQRQGEHEQAAEYLAEAAQRYGDMRDEAFYRLGDSLLRLGEHARAAAALAEVPASSPRFEEARAKWARALTRTESAEDLAKSLLRFVAEFPIDKEGVPALPPVPAPPRRQTGPVPPPPATNAPGPRTLSLRGEVTFALARALDEAGRPKDAAPHYLYTWARFPGTSAGNRAGSRLAELRRKIGSAAAPDAYYRYLRGRAYLASGQAKAARKVLSPLASELSRKGPQEMRWAVELALGVAMARSGDPAALRRFRGVAKSAKEIELRGEASYRAAEVLARRRQVARAVRQYRAAALQNADSRFAPMALSDGGELARLYGKHNEARALFERLVRNYPLHDRVARAHWRLGWYAYRANRFEVARGHFLSAVRAAPRGDDELRALYWLGRTEALLQHPAAAAAAYRTLVRVYPISYYGHLASRRLSDFAQHDSASEEGELLPWVGGLAQHTRAEFEDLRLVHARELIRLDLGAEARRILKRYEHARDRTAGGLMAVASLYREIGLERRAHWTLRSRAHAFRQHPTDQGLLDFWKQAYPRRFVKELELAARRAGVPRPLFFGLVREESTFEPRAVSPQRAIGLTQLLYETAQDMARVLKMRLRGRGDLYQPRINALLGARFLKTLLRTYRGRTLLAVAAYNAGPGNVDRWLARRGLHREGPVPEDEIVEDIPFEETRHYVRKVVGSYAAYARLYYGERLALAAPSVLPVVAVAP